MSWKDRALQAADTKDARDREAVRLRLEAERTKQIEAFGWAMSELLEEDITVDDLKVTVDGVTFGCKPQRLGTGYAIVVQGKCPLCQAQAWSAQIRSLEDLGQQLRQFTPDAGHQHHYGTRTKLMRDRLERR